MISYTKRNQSISGLDGWRRKEAEEIKIIFSAYMDNNESIASNFFPNVNCAVEKKAKEKGFMVYDSIIKRPMTLMEQFSIYTYINISQNGYQDITGISHGLKYKVINAFQICKME